MRVIALIVFMLLTSQFAVAGAGIDRAPLVTVGYAEAQLIRNSNVLSVSGRAMMLVPGNTYTVWWIVFDGSDIPVVVNASGGIANHAGILGFAGTLPVGTYEYGNNIPRYVELGGTLVDPLNAVVVFHVVDHGPPIPGLIPLQISALNEASCPVGCEMVTEIVFVP